MHFFTTNFRWVMLIAGLLTCTMLSGLISPQTLLKSTFGDILEGPLAEIIVRSWSALIGLMGIMLIYGAFVQSARRFSLVIVSLSKIIFIILVLSIGRVFFEFGAGTAVIVDSIMVVLFFAYLLFTRTSKDINNSSSNRAFPAT